MASKQLVRSFRSFLAAGPVAAGLQAQSVIIPPTSCRAPVIVKRFAHQIPRPSAPEPSASQAADTSSDKKPEAPEKKPYVRSRRQPSYELTFTCLPCGERSTHTITKQGYYYGSVLIACPNCRNRHVISDHLNVSPFLLLFVHGRVEEKNKKTLHVGVCLLTGPTDFRKPQNHRGGLATGERPACQERYSWGGRGFGVLGRWISNIKEGTK